MGDGGLIPILIFYAIIRTLKNGGIKWIIFGVDFYTSTPPPPMNSQETVKDLYLMSLESFYCRFDILLGSKHNTYVCK